jgi:hypothetical protein
VPQDVLLQRSNRYAGTEGRTQRIIDAMPPKCSDFLTQSDIAVKRPWIACGRLFVTSPGCRQILDPEKNSRPGAYGLADANSIGSISDVDVNGFVR